MSICQAVGEGDQKEDMPLGTPRRKVTRGWGLEAGRARRGAGHVSGVQTHGHVLALLGFWQGPASSASAGPHAPRRGPSVRGQRRGKQALKAVGTCQP